MKRGDLVTVAPRGDHGKPRPALVIQSDDFDSTATVAVLLLSGTLVDVRFLRVSVDANAENGLKQRSQIMIDKPMSVRRDKVGDVFGDMDRATMQTVNQLVALFLGLG